jgi:hypothetical protein
MCHTFLRFPHARDQWRVIAEVWDLHDDSMLQPTGTDWPIHFLHALTET